MRAVAAVAVAALLLTLVLPAQAHPFPQTEQAVRHMVRDTLHDTDAEAADLVRLAHTMVREARRELGVVDLPALPGAPAMPVVVENGELEVRATLLQPGVKDQDELLAVLWIGAKDGYWTGAYWVEGNGGVVLPNVIEINEMGALFFLEGGLLSQGDSVRATYHFLGIDGEHATHAVGAVPLLDEMPVLDRVDFGGAVASKRGEEPEALLVTPWNLMGKNVTMGMTLRAGESTLEEMVVGGCADAESNLTEPGCRILYVLHLPAAMSALQLWHVDEKGQRVVDRELSRLDLELGYTFG